MEKLNVDGFVCKSDAEAMAIATLVGRSEAVSGTIPLNISTEGVGSEGWAAVRGAVDDLRHTFGKDVKFSSDHKTMGTGQREDLKAIWDNVSEWFVHGREGGIRFTKDYDGEEGWWDRRGHRRGLEAFIDMTKEEWDAEMNRLKAEANPADI